MAEVVIGGVGWQEAMANGRITEKLYSVQRRLNIYSPNTGELLKYIKALGQRRKRGEKTNSLYRGKNDAEVDGVKRKKARQQGTKTITHQVHASYLTCFVSLTLRVIASPFITSRIFPSSHIIPLDCANLPSS